MRYALYIVRYAQALLQVTAASSSCFTAALQLLCSGYLTAALPRQSPLFGAQSLKIFSCAQTRRHKAFSFHQLQKSQAYREAQILI